MLRRFRGGTRRASPVARRVLVTVPSLPPRRRDPPRQPACDGPCCLRAVQHGLGLRGFALSRLPLRSLTLRPGNSLTILTMALSMGFRASVSLRPAIQATGLLALAPAGLPPAEHVCLLWTHGNSRSSASSVAERTVSRLMPTAAPQPSQTWRTFLDQPSPDLVSVDFFTVPTVLFGPVRLRRPRARPPARRPLQRHRRPHRPLDGAADSWTPSPGDCAALPPARS